jgi:predicted outer membrane repeat protein
MKPKHYVLVAFLVMAIFSSIVIAPGARSQNSAGNWYVAHTGSDDQDCNSPSSACQTINGAIQKAASGDTILIDASTYTSTSGEQVVWVTKSITLSGGWNGDFSQQTGFTIIDGSKARRGLVIDPNITVIAGSFKVKDGFGNDGGGILNNGSLTLNHIILQGNHGEGPGNGYGGGILNLGSLTIRNSTVLENFAYGGGGISNNGKLVVVNTTISGNTAKSRGGGISMTSSDVSFSTILKNSTVSGNHASSGGGISTNYGGVSLENTILANNTSVNDYAPNCRGGAVSLGYNLFGVIEFPCSITPLGTDIVNLDPLLGILIGTPAYLPLLSASPAINAGNPAGCTDELGNPLVVDQRNVTRDARCDIGAYEYTIPGILASIESFTGSPQTVKVNTRYPLPFQVLLLDQVGSPIGNTQVTFSAPLSGPSGIFSDTNTTVTGALTAETGIAIASAFTANETGGSYLVEANATGLPSTAQFSLTNIGQLYLPLTMKPCPMLYADNFADSSSGWYIGDNENSRYEYLEGEYRILVRPAQAGALTRPGIQSSEYVASVDLRNPSSVMSSYGIAFGVNQDWSYFYTFEIYPDGYYGIYLFNSSNVITLREGFSSYIQQGNATNRLKLVRFDQTITTYVNGSGLAQLTNMSYGSGYLGLAVFSYATPNVDIRFDNFTVYPGNCDPTASASSYSVGDQLMPGLEMPAFEIIDRDHHHH